MSAYLSIAFLSGMLTYFAFQLYRIYQSYNSFKNTRMKLPNLSELSSLLKEKKEKVVGTVEDTYMAEKFLAMKKEKDKFIKDAEERSEDINHTIRMLWREFNTRHPEYREIQTSFNDKKKIFEIKEEDED